MDRLFSPVECETEQVTLVTLLSGQLHVLQTVTVPLAQESCPVRQSPGGNQDTFAAGFPATALHSAVLFLWTYRITSGGTTEI